MKYLLIIYRKFKKLVQTPNAFAKDQDLKFGKNCLFYTKKFGSEPYLISFGDNCEVSYNVDFITHDGSVWVLRNMYAELSNIDILKQITIGNNVFIGANSTILPGVTIGDNVIIGAGSVVTKNISSDCVVAGVPANKILSIEEYRMKNEKYFTNTKNLNSVQKKDYIFDNILQDKYFD